MSSKHWAHTAFGYAPNVLTTPEQINGLFNKGALGIKFIAPTKSYGDDSYFPLYDAIATNRGLAVFHTGYVLAERFEPGCWDARRRVIDIADMRPSALNLITAVENLKKAYVAKNYRVMVKLAFTQWVKGGFSDFQPGRVGRIRHICFVAYDLQYGNTASPWRLAATANAANCGN